MAAQGASQSVWVKAGNLTAHDIGKGIWCRLRYKPESEWPVDLPESNNRDLRYEWGWARITMVTHTSTGITKVRIHGGGLVDWGYESNRQVNITTEEYSG